MIIQRHEHRYTVKVVRRGYPDTPESFSGGGFVNIITESMEPGGRMFMSLHPKDGFNELLALAEHWDQRDAAEMNRQS